MSDNTGCTPHRAISLSPTELDFANVGIGTLSVPRSVTLTNTGVDCVYIKKIVAVGDFKNLSPDFKEIRPGETVSLWVAFEPQQLGPLSGGLYVDTGNAGGQEFVSLLGSGVPNGDMIPASEAEALIKQVGDERYLQKATSLDFVEEYLDGALPGLLPPVVSAQLPGLVNPLLAPVVAQVTDIANDALQAVDAANAVIAANSLPQFANAAALADTVVNAAAPRIMVGPHEYRRVAHSVSADAQSLIGVMTVKPVLTRQLVLSAVLGRLKASPAWAKVTAIHFMAAHDQQAATINWKNPSGDRLVNNGATFLPDQGFRGDGVASYVDTQHNPATTPGVSATSIHIAAWSIQDPDNTDPNALIGSLTGNTLRILSGNGNYNFRLCDGVTVTGASRDPALGHHVATRTGNEKRAYLDGVLVHNFDTAPGTVPDVNLVYLRHNNTVASKRTVSMGHFGAGLTSDEVADLYSAAALYHEGLTLPPDTYLADKSGAVFAKADPHKHLRPRPIDILEAVRPERSELLFDLGRVGTSPGNVAQGIAIDKQGGHLYTHHVSASYAPPNEVGIINRFSFTGVVNQVAMDSSAPAIALGHQGLSAEPRQDGRQTLWASAPYNAAGLVGDNSGNGNYATRFVYVPKEYGSVTDIEYFKLFNRAGSNTSATPAVSLDGRFLVARQGFTEGGVDKHAVRVFDLKKLLAKGPGDHSGDYLHEFIIDRVGLLTQALQALCCDGAYIYLLVGDSPRNTNKALLCYTIDGYFVAAHHGVFVGAAEARAADSGDMYEPEGIDVAYYHGKPTLFLCFSAGNSGRRRCYVFGTGLDASSRTFFNDEEGWEYGIIRHTNGVLEMWGSARVTPTANTMHQTPVVFPEAFDAGIVPTIQVTPSSASDQLEKCFAAAATATGFNIVVKRSNTTPTAIWWRAFGRAKPKLIEHKFGTLVSGTVSFGTGVNAVRHLVGTGQSLSNGQVAYPPITETVRAGRVGMFNAGIRPTGTSQSSANIDLAIQPSQMASIIDAAGLRQGAGGETPLEQAGYEMTKAGALAASIGVLLSTHGIGGAGYDSIKKGTVSHANALAAVTRARELALTSGRTYQTPFIVNTHGENNRNDSLTTYHNILKEWQADFTADINAIIGLSAPVIMAVSQMSAASHYSMANGSEVPLAQLKAALDEPTKFICVGPKYQMDYADGVHLTAEGQALLASLNGRAIWQKINGTFTGPLRIASAVRTNAIIDLTYTGNVGNLVLDTTNVSNPGNFGFTFAQDGAAVAVSTVAVTGANTIRVTLASTPTGTNKKIQYAMKPPVLGVSSGPTTGQRGNVRDSSPDKNFFGQNMWNWACIQEMAVA